MEFFDNKLCISVRELEADGIFDTGLLPSTCCTQQAEDGSLRWKGKLRFGCCR